MIERNIRDLFGEKDLQDESVAVGVWEGVLSGIVEELDEQIDIEVKDRALEAIKNWKNHPDHGARHSYHVYRGMVVLERMDERQGEVPDSDKQALAVLHDLAQSLPYVDPDTGRELKGNQRKMHAVAMARLIKLVGGRLGVDQSELKRLAEGVRVHDDVYKGRKVESLPYSAQLLSDADKLYGAGERLTPAQMAAEAIQRNLKGSAKRDGWYLLRDLTCEERRGWEYGDRWLSDAASAVRMDMFGIEFYTKSGMKVAEERRAAFLSQAETEYGDVIEQTYDLVQKWVDGNVEKVMLVGKGQADEDVHNNAVEEVCTQAYGRRLDLEGKYLRGVFEPRGWKIVLVVDGQEQVVDPSVARLMFENGQMMKRGKAKKEFVTRIISVFKGEK